MLPFYHRPFYELNLVENCHRTVRNNNMILIDPMAYELN